MFLHVGTMKSGTSFLQSLWWRHRSALADRGLLLPGTRIRDHFNAASLVCERKQILAELSPEEERTWEDLLSEVAAWPADALISHELFSPATPDQAARALRMLEQQADELHVVLTTRDLARTLPSHWQQEVKHHASSTLTDYWERVRSDPRDRFWTFHDLPALLDRWTQGVPPDRVHVVVNPPRATKDWLWGSTCHLFGVDPTGLDLAARNPNESLGIAEVEVMRRVQDAIPEDDRDLSTVRLTKGFFARDILIPAGPGLPFVVPQGVHAWAAERGAAMAEEIRARDPHVIGDLADLVPGDAPQGRVPGDVREEEVTEVAVAALALMVRHERRQRERIRQLQAQRARLRRRLDAAGASAAETSDDQTRGVLGRLRRRIDSVRRR
jgi:hypothetical protein